MNLSDQIKAIVSNVMKRPLNAYDYFDAGAWNENDRLTPLILSLIECEKYMVCWCDIAIRSGYKQCTSCKVRENIRQVLEGMNDTKD